MATTTNCDSCMSEIVSNRLLKSYMHHRSHFRSNARSMIDEAVEQQLSYMHESLCPASITALREMAERLFQQGFLAGCRTCFNRKY